MVLDRGFPGLMLGMSRSQVNPELGLKLSINPIAALNARYISAEAARSIAEIDMSTGRSFYSVSRIDLLRLPAKSASVDAEFVKDVLLEIAIQYSPEYVEKIGFRALALPFVGKYGAPQEESGYVWQDDRTRLEINDSNAFINMRFTDLPLRHDVTQFERAARDLERQNRQSRK